ncbi:metal-dependent hydrolase [Croceibacterium mercuriale]|uniref:Metal-dependent hydrolase n=1 Tax=Croceibacterium mercuriale TaxID=1572751 RepID=A0A0B2BWX2_9SPHN|nr:SprT family zinc-dependent metalloprotease [Croceibacterium mercuriale]KHL24492.1 metal-dependent hydrolase [Croceibacterium mercuriale]
MIGWLRRAEPKPATIVVGERELPLAIRAHARATRLTMRLAPDGSEVRITMPRGVRIAEAVSFARSRRGWLAQQLARVPHHAPPAPGGTLLHRGTALPIDWHAAHPRTPAIIGGSLRCGGPVETLTPRLARWLATEAEALLADDLAHYCARAGVAAPALRLSRAQRRWGSCSSGGTVRINWRLIQAPDPVRRSVVAHEVAHLLHFDHSPAFHAALARIYDADLPAADRWLKAHGRSLYAAFG